MISIIKRSILFLAVVSLSIGYMSARGRDGYGVQLVTPDNGNLIEAFAITVGTTTPVKIFTSTATQFVNYRELLFQNVSTNSYRVFLGTHSAVSATTGGRWFIPGGGSWVTNAKDDLWAVYEPAAANTGTLQILGQFERDSNDEAITNR